MNTDTMPGELGDVLDLVDDTLHVVGVVHRRQRARTEQAALDPPSGARHTSRCTTRAWTRPNSTSCRLWSPSIVVG